VTFTPSRNFNGTTSFTYAVSDGTQSVTGQVSVLVTPVNDPPASSDRTFSTNKDTSLFILVSSLMFFAFDPDNDVVNFVGARATPETHGTVVVTGSDVRYTPDTGFSGQAKFEFLFSDGTLTGTGLAIINVRP
jgi:hypothetical protein